MKAEPYPSMSKTLRERSLLKKPESQYDTYPTLLLDIAKELGLNEKEILKWAREKYRFKFRTWVIKNGSEIIGSVTTILRPCPKDKYDKNPQRFTMQLCFLSKEDLFSKFNGHRWACQKLFTGKSFIINKPFKEAKAASKEIIMEEIKKRNSYKKFLKDPSSKIEVI
jgi:hypothetical protein